MEKRPGFAQKLLDDLRLRKQRLASDKHILSKFILTSLEEEYALRNVLVNDSHFLNAAQALLKVKIPIGILHEAENIQVRCFDNLIRELNDDFKSLEPQCMMEDNVSECLQNMIEKDIENRNPDVNCMWDTCWSNVVIAYVEKEQIVKDLEKHMLNGLINELVKDLIAVHCIS